MRFTPRKALFAVCFTAFSSIYSTGLAQEETPYFQQEVNYDIDVRLDEKANELHGSISFEYINNSPDSLSEMYVHLWPNGYKNVHTALGQQFARQGSNTMSVLSNEAFGGIDSLAFERDASSVKWELTEDIDIAKLYFEKPVVPGERTVISTTFRVDIPAAGISRLGHNDGYFQITQWYPKPAVYDVEGWHPMPYLNYGEFYSEFGSFEVNIDVPKNFVVGATGVCQNQEELNWLDSISAAVKAYRLDEREVKSADSVRKILTYKADKVHDFGWFTGANYWVLTDEFTIDGRDEPIQSYTYFLPNSREHWQHVPKVLERAVKHYSSEVGAYPYPQVSALEGPLSAGGGMEYPMITIIDPMPDSVLLDNVVTHEVGHNWFYGILGFDERRFPWMDEGMNSFYEVKYMHKYHKGQNEMKLPPVLLNKIGVPPREGFEVKHAMYAFQASRNIDQPIHTHSGCFSATNYGLIVYGKTSLALRFLEKYLGPDRFKNTMQSFYKKWKFKHPMPSDFRAHFEAETGEGLDWFFDNIIEKEEEIDFKVGRVKRNKDSYTLRVKRSGNMNMPVPYQVVSNGDTTYSWLEVGKDSFVVARDVDYVSLDPERFFYEINRKNNDFKASQLFKKGSVPKPRFVNLGGEKRGDLYVFPFTMGFNTSDGFMLGASFSNYQLLEKKWEYFLNPMYGFDSKRVSGFGELKYNHHIQNTHWPKVEASIGGQRYSLLTRTITEPIDGFFAKLNPKIVVHHYPKGLGTRTFFHHYVRVPFLYRSNPVIGSPREIFPELGTRFTRHNADKVSKVHFNLQMHNSFAKTSLTATHKLSYYKEKDHVEFRIFGGAFLSNTSSNPFYNFRMDGDFGGFDYTADHVMIDRAGMSSFWGQQFALTEGGFKLPTAVGSSNEWLVAANVKFDAPGKIPGGLYVDLGVSGSTSDVLYNAGYYLNIGSGIFGVYFPMLKADAIQQEHKTNALNYGQTIRFTLHLERLHLFNILDTISLM